MKAEYICQDLETVGQPGVARNKHPSFYENAQTENIKVLSSEKDDEKFSHSRPSPRPREKSPTKPTSEDGLSSLRGQEINRRKCSINEHLLSEEEKGRIEREFPPSEEKNLEVTVTEVIPASVPAVRLGLTKGTEKMREPSQPTCALRARQMKLDWLDGKSAGGKMIHFILQKCPFPLYVI